MSAGGDKRQDTASLCEAIEIQGRNIRVSETVEEDEGVSCLVKGGDSYGVDAHVDGRLWLERSRARACWHVCI